VPAWEAVVFRDPPRHDFPGRGRPALSPHPGWGQAIPEQLPGVGEGGGAGRDPCAGRAGHITSARPVRPGAAARVCTADASACAAAAAPRRHPRQSGAGWLHVHFGGWVKHSDRGGWAEKTKGAHPPPTPLTLFPLLPTKHRREWLDATHGEAGAAVLAEAAAEEAAAAAALGVRRVGTIDDLRCLDEDLAPDAVPARLRRGGPGAGRDGADTDSPTSVTLSQRRAGSAQRGTPITPDVRLYHRAVVVAQEATGECRRCCGGRKGKRKNKMATLEVAQGCAAHFLLSPPHPLLRTSFPHLSCTARVLTPPPHSAHIVRTNAPPPHRLPAGHGSPAVHRLF
jgi:hypothetical protein